MFKTASQIFLGLVLLQGCCLFTSVNAYPSYSPASWSSSFETWLATFDFSSSLGEKASECQGVPDGFYAYPDQCIPDYYACFDQLRYNLTCPDEGTVFDEVRTECVPLEDATCRELTTTTTRRPGVYCAAGENGFFPISACSPSYYTCIDGKGPYPQKCPVEGSVYDDSIKACTLPANVPGCQTTTGGSTTPSSATTETTASTETTPAAETTQSTASTARPGGCSQPLTGVNDCAGKADGSYCAGSCLNNYIICVGGLGYNYNCPSTAVFNGTICTSSAMVPECTATTATTTQTTETSTTASTESTTASTTEATTTTEQSTTTSPVVVSSTTVGSTTTARTCPPTNLTNTFTCPTSEGNYAIPGACSQDYYVCVRCSPYVAQCPNGAIFDPVLLRCTAAVNATCNQPFTCPAADGFYPLFQGACSSGFYICVAGNATRENCPGTSVFDPLTKTCKDKADASCKPALLDSAVIRSAACVDEMDGFYPFSRNLCRPDYYICISGLQYIDPSHQTCPADAVFDPVEDLCMPVEYASCPSKKRYFRRQH